MKILKAFLSLFKHSCALHREVVSIGYVRYGSMGNATFKTGTDCRCTKCGKKWME